MSPSPGESVPRALVLTVVHHPEDARIRFRQIPALLAAGWRITYAAPFTGYGSSVPAPQREGTGELRCLDLPRAAGRRRLRALFEARRLMRRLGSQHDVVLIHDPELLPTSAGLAINIVWDVHEDTAAAVVAKEWLPRPVRAVAAWAVGRLELWAERRMRLLLAEYEYQQRFRYMHAVVPNAVSVAASVQPPGTDRVVYLGSITMERGAQEVIDVARLLRARTNGALTVHVAGPAHGAAQQLMLDAHGAGDLHWHGFVPNDEARAMLDGALAGLSLLHDLPNYRHSMPTKVLEYMAHGVPVISTPLPIAQELIEGAEAGILVPFADPGAAVNAVLALRADQKRMAQMGRSGRLAVAERYDWDRLSGYFVTAMTIAAEAGPGGGRRVR